MLGILYKLTNTINNKAYIGKTYYSLEKRMSEHKICCKKYLNRPLYRAINKYGFDSFNVEILGQYPEIELENEEIRAIKTFDTYYTGYNATLGGDGKRYIDTPDEDIISSYLYYRNMRTVASKFKIGERSVSNVLYKYNIDTSIRRTPSISKRVRLVELNKEFLNTEECANYLLSEKISDASIRSIRKCISAVCCGSKNSYKKYTFEYI